MNTLAERVKATRKQQGISQAQLAAAIGVTQGTISDIERGRNARSVYTTTIAKVFGVDALWLSEGAKDGQAPIIASLETKSHMTHRFTRLAVRNGYLKDPTTLTCLDCGAPAQVYDHRDYNKPLDVEPVCHACNVKRGPAIPFVHVNDR